MRGSNGVPGVLARSYPAPALVPPSPWLGNTAAGQPSLVCRKTGREISVTWQPTAGEVVWQWLVQEEFGDQWRTEIWPAERTSRQFITGETRVVPRTIAVSAVTRFGNISPPAVARVETR
jgi:hypothetical protein